MPTTDRYGLEITTSSGRAVEHFQEGMDRLLSYSAGAEDAFSAALAIDPGLAVAHTGLALLALVQGDAATARAAAARARPRRRARGRVPPRRHRGTSGRQRHRPRRRERSRGAPGRVHGAARARLRRRLVVSGGARLRLPRGRPLRGVATTLRALASAVPFQRQRRSQPRP